MGNVARQNKTDTGIMTAIKFTSYNYENYLNDLGIPFAECKSNGGRIPDHAAYGRWLRINDPIVFNVGFQGYKREQSYDKRTK